ncbi:DNA-3-methyladenine glycosylase 2 family protein [Patescibacteria group bacterium]|nr:DNA-3-methyladenine glycosylase 2 family protein [Patescibacteria group bacterium]
MDNKAIGYLSKDPVLKKLIKQHPPFNWPKTGDIFTDLIESVINQQLSLASAASIYNRFKKLFKGSITPKNTLKLTINQLKNVGLSAQKSSYIQNVATAIVSGSLNVDKLHKSTDQEVMDQLTSIKGIGPWSANMILMFTLNRPDIFPVGDLGIRTAMGKLYKLDRENLKVMIIIAKKWSPYRTLASRYLWQSLS